MVRAVAGFLLAAIFLSAQSALAGPSDDVSVANVGPPAASSATDTGQVSAPPGSAVDTSQISPTRAAVASTQLSSSAPSAEAPRALSTVGQGRNPNLAPVTGADRCDPATPSSNRPSCARILESQSDGLDGATAPGTPTVRTDTTSSGLVNDVVNGGTGTVVPLPPK